MGSSCWQRRLFCGRVAGFTGAQRAGVGKISSGSIDNKSVAGRSLTIRRDVESALLARASLGVLPSHEDGVGEGGEKKIRAKGTREAGGYARQMQSMTGEFVCSRLAGRHAGVIRASTHETFPPPVKFKTAWYYKLPYSGLALSCNASNRWARTASVAAQSTSNT